MAFTYKEGDKTLVAVDCIIFGFEKEELKLLLVKRGFEPEQGKWSLMGGFLKKDETIDEAAQRVLFQLTGLHDIYLEQSKVFSRIDRDPVERIISVSYYALINVTSQILELNKNYPAKWFRISELPDLIFDHREMVQQAIEQLRYRVSVRPVGFELLPKKFTMKQLLKLYEGILDRKLDKRNFRKKILSMDLLIKLDEKDMKSSRKGSHLFTFDKKKYLQKEPGEVNFKL